jgi:polyhydroxyalkanoate synthesis regulator phasin
MVDAIKKTLLAGLGAAVITKEKAENALGDLVRQGKISAADARIMAEKITEQGRHEFEELSARLNEKLKELTSRSDAKFAARVDELEARVRALEARLEALRPPHGSA